MALKLSSPRWLNKLFTIFNVTSYYQNLNDDIMQEEEDIIDIIYEPSQESKFIFCYLISFVC